MKKVVLLIITFCIVVISANVSKGCNLAAPVITAEDVTATQISISWTGDPNTSFYKVRYQIAGSSIWIKTIKVDLATSYTLTGLIPGTTYVVRIIPYCNENSSGAFSNINIATALCSLPTHAGCFVINDKSARLSWTPGSTSNSKVRYREEGNNTWIIINTGTDTYTIISGLTASTTYQYEVNICSDATSWSPQATFKTLDSGVWKPNILCIYLDDCRYDSYSPDEGPSFYQSPGIDRIANEGVRFVYAFPALSLCSPSRASIMTGLYPHHHGVTSNAINSIPSFTFPTAAQILHDNGYYTGFTGKYGFEKFPAVTGFDYYLESSNDIYWNSTYDYNGQFHVVIPGHKTDVITNKALEFLSSVPTGERFLLYVAHKAPHEPYTPRTEDIGIYNGQAISIPDNFTGWTKNVPSIYNECNSFVTDTAVLDAQLVSYYELLAGAEASIDTILTYLADEGILDSTLVIFTSDNGLMIGEHMLQGKQIALEQSIRVPMFIRYPRWFAAGTVVTDEMAMNIDIAPTILEAAGIPDTFGMDGMSMRSLVNQTANRKELFYEYFYRNCYPTLTAVRDFNYKYIKNRCSNTVEEFYDLLNDPEENINLINSPNYSALIQKYRNKLDSLKQVYDYVLLKDTIEPCSLQNPDNSIVHFSPTNHSWTITETGSAGHENTYPARLGVDYAGKSYVLGHDASGYFVHKMNTTGTSIWTNFTGYTYNSAYGQRRGFVVDSAGNSYTAVLTAADPSWSSRVFKINNSGAIKWTVSDSSWLSAIALDKSGKVAVSGSQQVWNGNAWISNGVVIMYDKKGNLLWRYLTSEIPEASDLTMDNAGNIYFTGSNGNAYIIKLSSSGALLWTRTYNSGADDRPFKVLLDGANNIYAGGTGGAATYSGTEILKYDNQGNLIWAYINASDTNSDFTIDEAGNSYVINDIKSFKVNSSGNPEWSNSTITGSKLCLDHSGIYTNSLCKASFSGVLQWCKNTPSFMHYGDQLPDITVDNSGNIYCLGRDSVSSNQSLVSKFVPCSSLTCTISAGAKVTAISSSGSCNDGHIQVTSSGTFNSWLHLELYSNDNTLISSIDQQSTTAPYTFENLPAGIYTVKVFDESCCEFDLNALEVKCPKPAGFFTSAITLTGATVNWSNQGCNHGYKVQYRRQGTTTWTTRNPGINATSSKINGLTANTIYEWKVATNCANANPQNNSGYGAIQTFTTLLRLSENEEAINYIPLSIYPNPAGEMITVEVNANDVQFIQVKDPMGRMLIEVKISDQDSMHKLDVASLPPGIYLVTVKTASGILQEAFVK